MDMKKTLIIFFIFLLPFTSIDANEYKSYEMPRTQVVPIKNSETGAQDTLYIKLPEGYKDNNKKYPVIYFTHPKQHIEILSAATELLIEDVILVGISFQKDMKYGTEHSYMNFLRNDVINTIENNVFAKINKTIFQFSEKKSPKIHF